jgi:hypothetical protein
MNALINSTGNPKHVYTNVNVHFKFTFINYLSIDRLLLSYFMKDYLPCLLCRPIIEIYILRCIRDLQLFQMRL